jgi:hypothetical protein
MTLNVPQLLSYMGMDQYLLIPFLGEWPSIYQLFWCSPGVQGFDTLPYIYIIHCQAMSCQIFTAVAPGPMGRIRCAMRTAPGCTLEMSRAPGSKVAAAATSWTKWIRLGVRNIHGVVSWLVHGFLSYTIQIVHHAKVTFSWKSVHRRICDYVLKLLKWSSAAAKRTDKTCKVNRPNLISWEMHGCMDGVKHRGRIGCQETQSACVTTRKLRVWKHIDNESRGTNKLTNKKSTLKTKKALNIRCFTT